MKIIHLLWVLLLIVPILLNSVIGIVPAGWKVAGDTGNWVSFWGSYAGGCVTAIISYVILKKTIDYYKKENVLRIEESHVERLRSEVSIRLASLNVKKYTLLYERLKRGEPPSAICEILDRAVIDVMDNLSAFKILYMEEYPGFVSSYEYMANDVVMTLSEISNVVRGIPDDPTPSRVALIGNISGGFDRLYQLQHEVDELWEKASVFICSHIET